MPFTSSTPLLSIGISLHGIDGALLDLGFWTDETPSVNYSLNLRGAAPLLGSEAHTNYATLRAIYPDFVDADGNSITIQVGDGEAQGIYTYDDLVLVHGDIFTFDYFAVRESLVEAQVALGQHAEVTESAISGRKDISMSGGMKPRKGVPPSGDLSQSISDFFAEQVGSNARIICNAIDGEEFDNGSTGVAGTEVQHDVRLKGMIVYLESVRTGGDPLYDDANPLNDITEWSSSIFSGRTFSITIGLGDMWIFTISSSTSGRSRVTFMTARTAASDPIIIDDLNIIINEAEVVFPTDEKDEKPPFGDFAVPTYGERFVAPGGSYVVDRGIPAFWTPTKRKPIGARDILAWEDLQEVTSQTYRNIPFGVYNFAIHITSTVDRVIRIPDPVDIVPYIGGAIEFEVHNNNAHENGKSVELQTKNGNNIITLLGQESVPLELEWFKDGTGELRSPSRVPRSISVAGSPGGDFHDVGYFEFDSTRWARPIPIPPIGFRTVPFRINEEAFEMGTAAITNGSDFGNDNTGLHVEDAFKLKKRGRLSIDLQIVIAGSSSGTITGHALHLYEVDSSRRVLIAQYPQATLGVDDSRPWDILWQDEGSNISPDDVFLPLYVYQKSSTMHPSNVLIKSYRLSVILMQDILVTYT